MGNHGYKKYMKKEARKDNSMLRLFIGTLCVMLVVFTFLIKSLFPNADTSIGDYKPEPDVVEETKNTVDDRLAMIQNEDQGRSFSELMAKPDDTAREAHKDIESSPAPIAAEQKSVQPPVEPQKQPPSQDIVYKVFVGTYTSAEQAKVAKDIILESGSGLNPIVKCIGSNNYTLQVGIFKNKSSAESLLYTVQQNHLPGRIVQDY